MKKDYKENVLYPFFFEDQPVWRNFFPERISPFQCVLAIEAA